MDPLSVRNLLLILLLPLSDQNLETNTTAELDHSSRSIEFCLHVPGQSHWSSSKPDKPTPTKTVHPPTQPKPELEPAQASWGSTKPVTSTAPPGQTEEEHTTQQPEPITEPPPVIEDDIIPMIHHRALYSPERCHCDGKNMKLPTETSPVRSTEVRPPTENCRSPEFIEILQDGRQVCVTAHSFLTYFSELVRSQQKEPTTTVPPPTTELPTTTQPAPIDIKGNVPQCEVCTSDLENITLEAVQSLLVRMNPFPCSTLIYVNLKDDNRSICVDLDDVGFERLLENLGTLPSFPPDKTPKTTVNKCRCRDTEITRLSSCQSAMIWFPNDTCNSTQYIETLMDGTEVCVTPPSLLDYFDSVRSRQTTLKTVDYVSSQRSLEVVHVLHVSERIDVMCALLYCPPFDWTSIDSTDVESLQMEVNSFKCPSYLEVHLKQLDGRPDYFCVSTQELWFSDVLKKLDIN
ncbi:mucin-3B-like [Sphaeramia orbicularis]|uniref:mucin-3B-like n=1 Tax=Sphaeramia orbicularis TaxID=375764 RepID=UPI00117DA2E9|nr:mucin-3B-like [Sphaeramia orbicularis]